MPYTSNLDFGPYGNYGTMQINTPAPSPSSGGGDWSQGAGAGIQAAGQLVGAWLQNRAANKATESQARMTAASLAFEREKAAQRRKEFEERYTKWLEGQSALMRRYGIL